MGLLQFNGDGVSGANVGSAGLVTQLAAALEP
jgi:hypothetical protein